MAGAPVATSVFEVAWWWHDIAPRGGFSWAIGKGFVFRGGAGVFYSVHDSQLTLGLDQQGGQNVFANTYNNPTKNPDFINNWTQGATAATYVRESFTSPPQAFPSSVAPNMRDPRAIQATAGIQKQIGSSWVITSDLIYTKGEFLRESPNVNQNLDPPDWISVECQLPGRRAASQPGLYQRYSDREQSLFRVCRFGQRRQ